MSKPAFFIFSLPRSGTSWLSLFLTGKDSYCYHEPTADFSPFDWARHARNRPELTVGAIDTCAYRYAHLVRDAMPQALCFTIQREPHEIITSLEAASMHGMDVLEAYERIQGLGLTPLYYKHFGDHKYLASIWESLTGTEPDPEHIDRFLELRVERDVNRFIANRPQLLPHVRSMLQ